MTTKNIFIISNRRTDIVHYCLPINIKTLASLAYKYTGNTYDEKHTAKAMLLMRDVQNGKGYNGRLLEIFVK